MTKLENGWRYKENTHMDIEMNKEFTKILSNIEKEARDSLGQNKGHLSLILDLSNLTREASECQFHDMLNTDFPAPKMTLLQKLDQLRLNVVTGKYDN